jgi:hypothetical protein
VVLSRSTVLAADGTRHSLCGVLLAVTLLGAWGAWAFVARLALSAVTDTARLEVDRAASVGSSVTTKRGR